MFTRCSARVRASVRVPTALSVGLSFVLSACRDAPVQPVVSSEAAASAASLLASGANISRPDEASLERVGNALEEFGGYYFDASGNFVVYLTDLSRASQGTSILTPILAAYLQNSSIRGSSRIVFRQAQYRFRQLAAIRERVNVAVLNVDGVVYTDLDEARNRFVVGVSSASAERGVQRVLASLGVAEDAVIIELAEESRLASTLQDQIDPKGGGLKISLTYGSTTNVCSIGFTAKTSTGDSVLVTASHCTGKTWSVDGASVYQPLTTALGVETVDPAGSLCGPFRFCRNSDASLIHFTTPMTLSSVGLVHTTIDRVNGAAGSLTKSSLYGHIKSEATTLAVGDTLDKIGEATGWTKGVITKTCVDKLVGLRVFHCSTQTDGMVAGAGDSGAPVLVYQGKGIGGSYHKFALAGIVYAVETSLGGGVYRYTWMSGISGIKTDLGALTTY